MSKTTVSAGNTWYRTGHVKYDFHRNKMIIAVDGPSASGKGTLARAIAKHLGYHYLDTGAIYRMVGLSMLRGGHAADDVASATRIAATLDPGAFEDRELRNETVASITSKIAAMPDVRTALMQFQRDFARRAPGAVLDGRDIGTVVCPDADVKLFITATPEVRACRRHGELQALGMKADIAHVLSDIMARDARDSQRAIAPTVPAQDAIIIDTSTMTRDEALADVLGRLSTPTY